MTWDISSNIKDLWITWLWDISWFLSYFNFFVPNDEMIINHRLFSSNSTEPRHFLLRTKRPRFQHLWWICSLAHATIAHRYELSSVVSNRHYGFAFLIDDTNYIAGKSLQIAAVFIGVSGETWGEKGEGQFQGCRRWFARIRRWNHLPRCLRSLDRRTIRCQRGASLLSPSNTSNFSRFLLNLH